MPVTKNQSVATQLEVCFKEVDVIYDLPGARRLVGSESELKVVIDNSRLGGLGAFGFSRFTNELFEPEYGVTEELKGLYQLVRFVGTDVVYRYFARKKAKAVDKKWIYVWVADDDSGTNLRLLHEIYVEGGQMQLVNLAKNANKDDRKPEGPKRQKLLLDAVIFRDGKELAPGYFFILAPYQIPSAALALEERTIIGRAQRLFNPFWTDGYVGGDPSSPKMLHEVLGKKDFVGFLVYLVDPFKEAVRRSAEYVDALDAWEKKQTEMGKDDEYRLAKRIDAAFHKNDELYELVKEKLPQYLWQKEEQLRKLLTIAELKADNLIRWMGEKLKKEAIRGCDTAYSDGTNRQPYVIKHGVGAPEPEPWHNAFDLLVRDYLYGSDELYEKVVNVVGAVHARLAHTSIGDAWLSHNFEKASVDEHEPKKEVEAEGGAALLFQVPRKYSDGALKGFGLLIEHYADKWVEHFGEHALKSFKNWSEATHKLKFHVETEQGLRRARATRKSYRIARKRGLKHLKIESPGAQPFKAKEKTWKWVQLGIEIVNLSYARKGFASSDPFERLDAIGSACDAVVALSEVWEGLEEYEVELPGMSKTVKIVPIIGLVSAAIDLTTSMHEIGEAPNFGSYVGHGLRVVGSALTVAGATGSIAAPEAVVPEVLAMIGVILQGTGAFILHNFTKAGDFLQHCRWGNTKATTDVVDWIAKKTGHSTLSGVQGDIPKQHKLLDEIVYDFKPKLYTHDDGSVLSKLSLMAKMDGNPMLNSESEWEIEMEIEHVVRPDVGFSDTMPPEKVLKHEKWKWEPSEYFDDEDVSAGKEFTVRWFAPKKATFVKTDDEKAVGRIRVLGGKVEVDVFGDGKVKIEREIERDSWALEGFFD